MLDNTLEYVKLVVGVALVTTIALHPWAGVNDKTVPVLIRYNHAST